MPRPTGAARRPLPDEQAVGAHRPRRALRPADHRADFGYLTNSTSPSRIPVLFLLAIPLPNLTPPSQAWYDLLVQLHRLAAITLVATALAHALIAVVHHRRGSLILRRMWRG